MNTDQIELSLTFRTGPGVLKGQDVAQIVAMVPRKHADKMHGFQIRLCDELHPRSFAVDAVNIDHVARSEKWVMKVPGGVLSEAQRAVEMLVRHLDRKDEAGILTFQACPELAAYV